MSTPRVLTYNDLRNILTPMDRLDAASAGIVPKNIFTNDADVIIKMDTDIYFWLRNVQKDPRVLNTLTEREAEEQGVKKTEDNNEVEEQPTVEQTGNDIKIIGKVIDQDSNEELGAVNIKILSNGNFIGGTTTDFSGNINTDIVLNVGTYTFDISYIGYSSKNFKKQITATTKELNLNTIKLKEESEVLDEVEVISRAFLGKVADKRTKKPIIGATILSDIKETNGSKNQQTKSKAKGTIETTLNDGSKTVLEFQDGDYRLVLDIDFDKFIRKPNENEDSPIKTVVVGGLDYATKEWMREQYKTAGLSVEGVEFLNYDEKTKFTNLINQPTVRNIIGFSAGGLLIWPQINKDYDFIGLIDPSTFKTTKINVPPGLPGNVRLMSNSNNWSTYKNGDDDYLYNNLLSMERNGASNKVNKKHKLIPKAYFKLYSSLLEPQIPTGSKKFKNITAVISAEGYSQSDPISLVTGNGDLIPNLGLTLLMPNKDAKEEAIINNKLLNKPQKDIINKLQKKDFVNETLKKMFKTIQDRLVPAIIDMLMAFGISKFNEAVLKNIDKLPKTCPPNIEELNKLLTKKNQLTKQLNNLYKLLNNIHKFLQIPEKVINISGKVVTGVNIAFKVISMIPSTTFTPIPAGGVLILKDLIEKLKDLIDFMEGKLGSSGVTLKVIIEELRKVIVMLQILDALAQSCAEGYEDNNGNNNNDDDGNDGNNNIGDDNNLTIQESISNELLLSTQNQANQGSQVPDNLRGFFFSVVNVDNVTINGLKRRRALAKNSQGITLLKGEPSFSSNDQILIDELIFYIQQNDLKAE